ncbi:MAG: DNA mismatch repair protein [Caeruleum heppii]|nr:MAG: DNA mismatch repair protein [Caeruleum heppii]
MDVDGDQNESHRQTLKRKAEELPSAATRPSRRIKALDQDVVNKIAAGEIIVAPVHALKELIENAVDAGATSLEILVKDGGLKLLQITDNGHGINKDDLSILCERFTTSKLKAFEDLTSIGTYGFRGEALASISHIAHLTVTTKIKESNCAWRAHYSGGQLTPAKPGQSPDPKPTAGRQGTQITVEDLFYNVPTRRRAFRSASEEYAKILDLVGRYAVHCSGVSFTCKKHGDSTMGISVQANATTVDRIRQIHGSTLGNELLPFEASDDRLGFLAEGWASNANYHVKRTTLLLFINHRAVESSTIKKAVEACYSTFLPKGGHPFVYLSLHIDPQRVDVNVHPTKREVNFLNEDDIIENICDELRLKLADVDTSRTFMTQSLLPGARIPTAAPMTPSGGEDPSRLSDRRTSNQPKTAVNNLIRTDSKMRKITSMLPPGQTSMDGTEGGAETPGDDTEYEISDRQPLLCRLTSVKALRAEVRDDMHSELTETFAGHTFVGVVDESRRIAAIQCGVKLLLVDYGMVCNEYFYQLALTNFANFGRIKLNPPLSLESLFTIALAHDQTTTNDPPSASPAQLSKTLISHAAMLSEYFALDISPTGDLQTIPLLLKGYTPSLAKLPAFLLGLSRNVDWREEKACFRSFLKELAAWYVPECLPAPTSSPDSNPSANAAIPQQQNDDPTSTPAGPSDDTPLPDAPDAIDPALAARRRHVHRALENLLFPAFKARLVATRPLLRAVVEVANLKGLYRVFERC